VEVEALVVLASWQGQSDTLWQNYFVFHSSCISAHMQSNPALSEHEKRNTTIPTTLSGPHASVKSNSQLLIIGSNTKWRERRKTGGVP